MGCETKNYAVHTPMLINKARGVELCKIINGPMIRCVYGNYFKVGGVDHRDFKIDSVSKVWSKGEYLSTNDKSFNYGKVGEQLKTIFKQKCQYEK